MKTFGFSVRWIGGHYLCPELVPRGAKVVDIGANRGVFIEASRRVFGAEVYAVEPTPQLFQSLQNELGLHKIHAAISNFNGRSAFHIRDNCEASSLLVENLKGVMESIEVETLTLPALFDRLGLSKIDILKVDAEGAELKMFDVCPQEFMRKISQICVEFHEWMGIGTRKDVEGVIQKINSAGFRSFSLVRGNYQAVLFVNRRYMSAWQYWCTWLRVWVPRVLISGRRKILSSKVF